MNTMNIERTLNNAHLSLDEMLQYISCDECPLDTDEHTNEQFLVVMKSVRKALSKLKGSRERDIAAFDYFISEKQAMRSRQLAR